MRSSRFAFLLCALTGLRFVSPAIAADHTNLEEGLPTQVEDANAVPYKSRELQIQGSYERTADGGNRFILIPRLEIGTNRNGQLKIDVPGFFGSQTRGSGDLRAEYFYNFNKETLRLPAFALSARLTAPTGRRSRGLDTQYKFILSKYLGRAQKLQRVHLNVLYFNNARAEATERGNRYGVILGYSQRLNADTMLVGDYVRQQEVERGQTSNVLELGVRRQLSPLRVLSFAVGAGLGHDSPDLRLTLGFQKTF